MDACLIQIDCKNDRPTSLVVNYLFEYFYDGHLMLDHATCFLVSDATQRLCCTHLNRDEHETKCD